jgi:3-oxoacyl-[acyl-carrier-protein] synthase II
LQTLLTAVPQLEQAETRSEVLAQVLSTRLQRELARPEQESLCALEAERIGVAFSTSKVLWPYLDEQPGGEPLFPIARQLGADGPLGSPVAACATGAHCLALGAQWIDDGYADVVLAGALERPQHELVLAGYQSLGALSASGVMRPFDRRRDGFVPGCGFGFVVLENAERARARGAGIQAYLSGWSMRADATGMTTMHNNGDTIARAIDDAMRRAACPAVGYINAHGTATHLNDVIEARAIGHTMGTRVPVSSTKAHTGHLLGAAGAVEGALCVKVLEDGYLPPTLHLEEPDNDCDLALLQQGQLAAPEAVMSLSYGFGGHIGVLIFEKAD